GALGRVQLLAGAAEASGRQTLVLLDAGRVGARRPRAAPRPGAGEAAVIVLEVGAVRQERREADGERKPARAERKGSQKVPRHVSVLELRSLRIAKFIAAPGRSTGRRGD